MDITTIELRWSQPSTNRRRRIHAVDSAGWSLCGGIRIEQCHVHTQPASEVTCRICRDKLPAEEEAK